MVAPLKMDMDMHMLGAMYAPSDNLTLNIMVPYVKNSMDHVTRMGVEFETVGEGLGDTPSATDLTVLSRGSSNDSPHFSGFLQHKAPERFTSSAGQSN